MDKDFWHERWRTGQIGFHSQQPHWALEHHWRDLDLSIDERVLVPLCGKSLDMRWLRQCGHPVDGVELDRIAVRAFFDEWRSSGALESAPEENGALTEADGVRLWTLDFFEFRPEAPLRAFYDRAAMIALPEPLRRAYCTQLRSCLDAGAAGLLVTLEYPQYQKDGPPFSVGPEEVNAISGFKIQVLARRDVLAESPKFRERRVTSLHEAVYKLTAV